MPEPQGGRIKKWFTKFFTALVRLVPLSSPKHDELRDKGQLGKGEVALTMRIFGGDKHESAKGGMSVREDWLREWSVHPLFPLSRG